MSRTPVWSWQDAIRQADVPPGTKLLCLTISLYLSSAGRYAWPHIETLVRDTGMKHRAIAKHIKIATQAGLLYVRRKRQVDGTLGGNTYHPRFPDNAELPQHVDGQNQPPAKNAHGANHPQKMRIKRTTQERGYDKGGTSLVKGEKDGGADTTPRRLFSAYWPDDDE